MFDEEISPEELFNRFFGGGGGGYGPFGMHANFQKASSRLANHDSGGGMFDAGPQFVFNMGGGPGFRVHQFGGQRARRRPRDANGQSEAPQSGLSALTSLLPLILLFVFPLISSLFSGSSTPSGPSVRFDSPVPPHTLHRVTPKLKVDYYVNPREVEDFSSRKFYQLDQRAEVDYVSKVRYECELEVNERDRQIQDAQGWFFPDVEKMKAARAMPLDSCRRLDTLGVGRGGY